MPLSPIFRHIRSTLRTLQASYTQLLTLKKWLNQTDVKLLIALMILVLFMFPQFPYLTEDEGYNFQLGLIGVPWPDNGVLWIGLIKVLKHFFDLSGMRYVTTLSVIGFVWGAFVALRGFIQPRIAFVAASSMLLGTDILVNLHKVRPEAFISLFAGAAFLFLHWIAQKNERINLGATVVMATCLVFGFTHMHAIGIAFIPPLWIATLFIVYSNYGGRTARNFAVYSILAFAASGIAGAIPYLNPASLEQLHHRIPSALLYNPHEHRAAILQAVAEIWRVQGDNLGELAPQTSRYLAPEFVRRSELFLGSIFIILSSLQCGYTLRNVMQHRRLPQTEIRRTALQLFAIGSLICFITLMFISNHLTNYYMSLYFPLMIVCAASLVSKTAEEFSNTNPGVQFFNKAGLIGSAGFVLIAVLFTVNATFPYRHSTFPEAYSAIKMNGKANCSRFAVVPAEYTVAALRSLTDPTYQGQRLLNPYAPRGLRDFLDLFRQAISQPNSSQCPQRAACAMIGKSEERACIVSMGVAQLGFYSYQDYQGTTLQSFMDRIVTKFSTVGYISLPNYRNDPLYPFNWGRPVNLESSAIIPTQIPGTPNYYFGGQQQIYIQRPTNDWDEWCSCAFKKE